MVGHNEFVGIYMQFAMLNYSIKGTLFGLGVYVICLNVSVFNFCQELLYFPFP